MSADTRYPQAPITEAIVDFQVKPRSDLSLEQLQELAKNEESAYPRCETLIEAVATMEVKLGVSASASTHQQDTGYKFISSDEKNVCQVRKEGFTFSRLAPYQSWAPFRDEAKRLWSKYREQTAPEQVTRLAVRYVNRIDIPGMNVDLKDYFRTTPEVSLDLPQVLAGFFMQVRFEEKALKAKLLINHTIIPPAREGVLSVVLDIDLFRNVDIPDDAESIWEYYEKLRVRKNEVFEACITDRTRELIK